MIKGNQERVTINLSKSESYLRVWLILNERDVRINYWNSFNKSELSICCVARQIYFELY